jgi:cobalt-zinc-cadmium efflux system membrane fusion protein
LRRDEDVLTSLRETAASGAVPPRSLRDAERDVEADKVAVARAERTLRSWRLSDDEVAAIRTEAADLAKPDAKRADPANWPLSVISSPRDGVVIQMDTSPSAIVDPSTPLFFVADLSHLTVWANVYEEDLPILQSMPQPVRWTVDLQSRPGTTFTGTLDTIGNVIQPDQHTALVSGRVNNADGSLKAGMAVTVTVDLPKPPAGEIEIPSEAMVEGGHESIVFVRSSSDHTTITRHQVKVAKRFRDAVYLAENAGIHAGDEVITSGSLLLNEAMNEIPAPKK